MEAGMNEHILDQEQRETAMELADLMRLAQEMGRRLANETHGDLYEEVRKLVTLLHQTRLQADLIEIQLTPDYAESQHRRAS